MDIKRPYLVQRITYLPKRNPKTWSDVLNLDYMGSSEFEFGAIPKAYTKLLKACANNKPVGKVVPSLYIKAKNGKDKLPLYIIGRELNISDLEDYVKFLTELRLSQGHTKEYTDFNAKHSYTDSSLRITDLSNKVWFDLDNQLFFTFNKSAVLDICNLSEEVVKTLVKNKWFDKD